MARLQDQFREKIAPALIEKFGYTTPMQVPRITKITLNMGVSEAVADKKVMDNAVGDMTKIAGQKPVVTKAKKAIAGFKIREDLPIGCMVTLRGVKMYEFLDRFVTVALPRVRDFRGISGRAFDGRGNYNIGVKEQIIFPEIEYDKVDALRGLNLRENDLLFHADVVVAAAVKGPAGNTAEVTHTGQSHGDETIQEFIHLDATQCDHAADRQVFADFETGDGFLGLGDHRLLTGDFGHVAHGVVHDFLVGNRLAHTHIECDLGDAGNLHRRCVAEFFNQGRCDFLAELILQACHVYAALISSPLDLKTRTFLPSANNLIPTRSALPVAALKIATLDW